MRITLEGKVALVTGGGAGIGRAIVDAYRELDAKVVVAELDADKCEKLNADLGDDGFAVQADVRNDQDVDRVRKAIEERFGRLDVLVNNVGHHLGISGRFEDTVGEQWDALYDINLRHMFVVTKAMLPLIRGHGRGGSIINLSSIEGFRGFPNSVAYTTFKHAVTGFTRSLAVQLAPEQIRVNTIGPETTRTEQVPLDDLLDPQFVEAANRTIPMGRFGKPEDHAGAAVFFATELSGWVTGQEIMPDGGGFAAGGFKLTEGGQWTIIPVVTVNATRKKPKGMDA